MQRIVEVAGWHECRVIVVGVVRLSTHFGHVLRKHAGHTLSHGRHFRQKELMIPLCGCGRQGPRAHALISTTQVSAVAAGGGVRSADWQAVESLREAALSMAVARRPRRWRCRSDDRRLDGCHEIFDELGTLCEVKRGEGLREATLIRAHCRNDCRARVATCHRACGVRGTRNRQRKQANAVRKCR